MSSIIVTGASGNLGRAIVDKFLSLGYRVMGTVIPNDPVPIEIGDPKFSKITVDLGDENVAGKFVQSCIQSNNAIEAAVLTVGGFAMGKIADTTSADIFKQYRLNFETAYHVARPIFQQMLQQGYGRIFLIGSRPGLDMHNSKGMVAYGLTKSLLFRLAELMNDEAKGKNVVVSVVVPSTIDTPQNRKSMPKADPSKWVKPESIADVIAFYCSEEASILREPVIKVYGESQ